MRTSNRFQHILIISALIFSVGINPTFAAGRTNKTIANTVLNGKGAPTTKVGINGDFYIDVLTFNMYGPKANNRWPITVSLKGPTGTSGTDGKPGEKGNASSGSRGEIGRAHV